MFYKDVAGLDTEGSKQRSASQSSLDKLDQELKVSVCARTLALLVPEAIGLALWSKTNFWVQLLIGITMPLLTPHPFSFQNQF